MPDDEGKKPDEGNVVPLPERKPSEEKPQSTPPLPEPSEEERVMQQQMAAHLAGMIAPFCPNMDEPALLRLAAEGMAEQAEIHEQIMPTFMANSPFSTSHPSIRVVVQGLNGKEGTLLGPKRLEGVEDPQPAVIQALLMSLLLTPSTRMALKAWGFRLSFEQVAQDATKPPPTIHRV